MRTKKAQERFG